MGPIENSDACCTHRHSSASERHRGLSLFASNCSVARADATLANGALSTKLDVPAGLAAGDYHVKVYADDGTHDAVLSAIVTVKP